MRAFDVGGGENEGYIAVVEALFPIVCRDLDADLFYFIDWRINEKLLYCLCFRIGCLGSFKKSYVAYINREQCTQITEIVI